MTSRVNARARTREDRAGDPLDGLVNLFDLGIVLSVAFLLAALSSLDLTQALFAEDNQRVAPGDSVVVGPGEESEPIELQPGERVVGQGEPVGTVYRLDDGRTIIVQPEGTTGTPGTAPDTATGESGGSGAGGSGAGGSTAPDSLDDDIATDDPATGDTSTSDEPTLGEQ